MIAWEWHRELSGRDAAEVAELLAEAVAYDEEAGFSTARPDLPAEGAVRHLLVTMPPVGSRGSPELDALPDVRVVAYLRVAVTGGVGTVQFVVRPAFRSRGVATLLFEQLDERERGWASIPELEVLQAWAHGSHPAADRMCGRFGGSVENAVFRTLRAVGGSRPFVSEVGKVERKPASDDAWEIVAGHREAMSPHDREVLSRTSERLEVIGGAGVAFIGAAPDNVAKELGTLTVLRTGAESRAQLADLVGQALLVLQSTGVRMVQSHVPALDDLMVSVARELDLVHDQSDTLYRRPLMRA